MTLQQLQYFRELARTQHYTRAAEALMVSQPSLSYAMGLLEKELGVKLFQKKGRGVVLTPAGHLFARRVDNALSELDKARTELEEYHEKQQHTLVIGYIFSLAQQVQPMIAEFLAQPENQGAAVKQMVQHSSMAMAESLRTGKVSAAVCITPPEGAQCCLLEEQNLQFAAAKTHPLAGAGELQLSQLLDQPLILVGESTSLRGTILDFFRRQGTEPLIGGEAEECNAAAAMASAGQGYTILPGTRDLERDGLVPLTVRGCRLTRPVYLAWRSQNENPLLTRLCRFAAEYFARSQPKAPN